MQHTEKYRFDLIERDDVFSPDALNENMEKVEAALDTVRAEAKAGDGALDTRLAVLEARKIVVGTYTGTGGTQQIQLGFKPRLVILMAIPGYLTDVPHYGLAYADRSFSSYLVINDVGFSAKADNSVNLNHDGWTYLYAAFR